MLEIVKPDYRGSLVYDGLDTFYCKVLLNKTHLCIICPAKVTHKNIYFFSVLVYNTFPILLVFFIYLFIF